MKAKATVFRMKVTLLT